MIIVVEGISASGKTTWCAQHGADHVVPETGRVTDAPFDPVAAAAFWSDHNARRWQAALATEDRIGLAVCDTDPLKLHYAWCLWQIGEASENHWHLNHETTRQSFRDGRIGFADSYVVKTIEPHTARRQRDADPARTRRNFELHLRLQPALIAWYEALGAVLPGRVQFHLPAQWTGPADAGPTGARYDVALFDQAMTLLPAARVF